MISTRIPSELPSLPSPSGNNTHPPSQKDGEDGKDGLGASPLHGKGSESAPSKAERKTHTATFRREMAMAAKAKDFSADGSMTSSVKATMASAVSPRQIVEPKTPSKKSDSKKTSPVPTAALPAPVDVWAGFVLPSTPDVPNTQTDTAPAVPEGQAAEGAEKTTGQLSALSSEIPSKIQPDEKSAVANVEISAPSVSSASFVDLSSSVRVSIPSQAKPSLAESRESLPNSVEAMVRAPSILHSPLMSGQNNKISQASVHTENTSREPDFATLSAIASKKSGTSDLPVSMKSHFTDQVEKSGLGETSSSEVASVQPLGVTSSSVDSIFMVPLSSASTALPGSPTVVTPSGSAIPINTSGWQAALAARAGSLQPGQSLLVRTDPTELGPIQVEATLRAGQGEGLHIQLTAKHSGTAQMLQQSVPVIAQMMTTAGAGVPVSVGVTMTPSAQNSFSSFSFSQGNPGQGDSGRSAPGTPFGSSTNGTPTVEQKMTGSSSDIHTKGFESWI